LLYIGRTLRIGVLSIVFALRFCFRGSRGPYLLRKYFEECGGAFVKLGQILAMRYDLFPLAYCEEMAALLDRLPPVPLPQVVDAIERDFQRPLNEVFPEFDPAPLSSASVAQVHRARLADGAKVVVKVRRPGIERLYRADLLNLRLVFALAEALDLPLKVDLGGLGRELRQLTQEELDFHAEARNIYILHELMEQDDLDHCSPQVYLTYSTSSVLTMQELEGVWLSEMLEAVNRQDRERLERWAQAGITPERTARLLLRSILKQCFNYRVFHADPHAANLLVLDGGTLGYVDFGMIGSVDERSWARHFRINSCVADENVHGAYEALLDLVEPLPNRSLAQFEGGFKRLVQNWILASKVPGSALAERSAGIFFLRLFDLLRRENLRMSTSDLRLTRALVVSDIVILKLCPGLERIPELRAFFREEAEHQFESQLRRSLSAPALLNWLSGGLKAFQALPRLADWLADRLPQVSRRYQRGFSRLEAAFLHLLRQVRLAAAVAALFLLICKLAALLGATRGMLGRVAASGLVWWEAFIAGALVYFALAGLIRRLQ